MLVLLLRAGGSLTGGLGQAIARHFEAIGKDEVRAADIYDDEAVLEYVQRSGASDRMAKYLRSTHL